jgi:hypothetical protein
MLEPHQLATSGTTALVHPEHQRLGLALQRRWSRGKRRPMMARHEQHVAGGKLAERRQDRELAA